MKGKILFLAALALVQGRPNENELNVDDSAKIRHELCPDDLSHFLLPHEYDCTKFYYCEFGEKFTSPRSCPPGTEFSFELQVCVDPSLANCTLPGAPSTPQTTELPTEAPTQPPTTTKEPPSTPAPDLPNGCPADFNEDRLLPHETYCNKFYQCNFGEKVVRWCPNGTFFNPRLSLCDWPGNAACDGEVAEEKEDEDNGNGDGGNGDDGDVGGILPNGCPANFEIDLLLPNPANCSTYYQCVHGENVPRNCPADLHFNPAEKICDWPEKAGCDPNAGGGGGGEGGGGGDKLPNGCPADFKIELLLPNPANCSTYYHCAHGDKVPRNCPAGLHFNPVKKICDWPASAGCDPNAGGGGGGEGGDEGGGEGGGEGEDEPTPSPPSPPPTPPPSPPPPPPPGGEGEDENKCVANCNVLPWAHKTDCDKFWICDGQKSRLVICSEGLHFNRRTFTCDFICNANCVRNNIQITAGVQGVKLFLPWNKIDRSVSQFLITDGQAK